MQGKPPPKIKGHSYRRLLGSGGFADVYEYKNEALDQGVAIKVYRRNHLSSLATLKQEAQSMARLREHPNIVKVYDAGTTEDGLLYLAMDLCRTKHLGLRIEERPLSVKEALSITIQLAGAVASAHSHGIMHRDIKPANVLFTSQTGRPALTDFGIAFAPGHGAVLNAWSPLWTPPERYGNSGTAVEPSYDVFSLGATMWAMLVGRSPLSIPGQDSDSEVEQRAKSYIPRPTGISGVPESLEIVLQSALAPKPDERYPCITDFAYALVNIQLELGHPATELIVFSAPSTNWTAHEETGRIQHDGTRVFRGKPTELSEMPEPEAIVAPELVPPSERAKPKGGLIASLVAAIVLLLGATVIVSSLGASTEPNAQRTPFARPSPVDPGRNRVPPVEDLRGTLQGDKVLFKWKNAVPEEGDSFIVQEMSTAEEMPQLRVVDPEILVDKQPGQTCVQVVQTRGNGRASAPARACVPSG